jgi:molybdate transport system ATP-binding protein
MPVLQPSLKHSLHVEVRKRYAQGMHLSFQLHVAFTAHPGVTILVGASGAGKSTLLRTIAGLCDPEEGRIVVAGRVLFDSEKRIRIEPAKRNVAFVFQDLALFPHLTVQENVSYGLRKLEKAEREHKAAEILRSFQITKLHKRKPREISGGEQQRVALARSLVTEPSVLLLDEPLSSLDAHTKAAIIDDLRAWNEAHRIPILHVTHSPEEAFALGEHAISLEQGRIAAQGAPSNVVTMPHRQSLAQFASFENIFEAVVVEVRERQGTMICRLAETAIDIELPQTRNAPGTPVHVGIKADEILVAIGRPAILSPCNLIHGRVKQVNFLGHKVEVRIDSGAEFFAHVPAESPESLNLKPGDSAWMLIRPKSCHLIRAARMRATKRLLVFICNRNTHRSPIAAAICNAEIARRLKVVPEVVNSLGVHAVSAGLSATPGDPIAIAAREALNRLQVPVPVHHSQNLTADLAGAADRIYCMTESQRLAVLDSFPEAASKTFCLQPAIGLEDPHPGGQDGLVVLAKQLQQIIDPMVDYLLAPAGLEGAA